MTEIVLRDKKSGCYKPFNLTPRRKQILWHIAYTDEVHVRMIPAFSLGHPGQRVPAFFLDQTNIDRIVILLKRARMVHFYRRRDNPHLHLKPLGMQVLLESLP